MELAGRRVELVDRRRRHPRAVADPDERLPPVGEPGANGLEQLLVERDVGPFANSVAADRQHADLRQAALAQVDDDRGRRNVDVVDTHLVAWCDDGVELVKGGQIDRPGAQREVDRIAVVEDKQPVLASDDGVVDRVLDAVDAGDDDPEFAGRVAGIEESLLGRDLRLRGDDEEAVRRRTADARHVAVIGLVVHEYVV